MKTSALFAVCMAVATVLSASNVSDADFAKCREFKENWNEGLSNTQMIEKDLISGRWSNDLEGLENTYFFIENGMLQIFVKDIDGYQGFTVMKWSVRETANQPVLYLIDEKGTAQKLFVKQNCEGLTLTDIDCSKSFYLDYHPFRAGEKMTETEANLIGEWTNVTALESDRASKHQQGAFLNYQFFQDGSFSLEYGNALERIQESGSWEISKDCQFLLLKDETNGFQVIKITQLDEHGLVLEQVMKTNEISAFFKASNKTFAFIK